MLASQFKSKISLEDETPPKVITNRVIKTQNIDVFLRCDEMTIEELQEVERQEALTKKNPLRAVVNVSDQLNTAKASSIKESLSKQLNIKDYDNDEEDDPEWGNVDIEEVKSSKVLP